MEEDESEEMIVKNLTPPRWFQRLQPQFTWSVPNARGTIYLTFDDGPTLGVTDWVLDELRRAGARATFFCIGHNAERYPDLLERIVREGHAVGNHTYSHITGYGKTAASYMKDVELAGAVLGESRLFRPPYGRVSAAEVRALRALGYDIILWSRLSMDYSNRVSAWDVLRFATEGVRSGDILAFHDSYKAEQKLRYALPRALETLRARGFGFAPLGMPVLKLEGGAAQRELAAGIVRPVRVEVQGARGIVGMKKGERR